MRTEDRPLDLSLATLAGVIRMDSREKGIGDRHLFIEFTFSLIPGKAAISESLKIGKGLRIEYL